MFNVVLPTLERIVRIAAYGIRHGISHAIYRQSTQLGEHNMRKCGTARFIAKPQRGTIIGHRSPPSPFRHRSVAGHRTSPVDLSAAGRLYGPALPLHRACCAVIWLLLAGSRWCVPSPGPDRAPGGAVYRRHATGNLHSSARNAQSPSQPVTQSAGHEGKSAGGAAGPAAHDWWLECHTGPLASRTCDGKQSAQFSALV